MFPSPRVDDHDGWVIAGWQPRAWQRSMRPPRLSQSHVAPTGSAIRARSFAGGPSAPSPHVRPAALLVTPVVKRPLGRGAMGEPGAHPLDPSSLLDDHE
jgi:hypothetical protein